MNREYVRRVVRFIHSTHSYMKIQESEVLKIKFTDQEISDFRTLIFEILQATRKT